jgi:hypothetical protein
MLPRKTFLPTVRARANARRRVPRTDPLQEVQYEECSFAIEVLVCPRCAGPRRILGAVTEPHAVRRLLAALGLAPEPPPGRPVTAS